ncbi:hypothetical protein SCLCIDRAFT_111153 [Scleroderma citrinum Foug A]|uniref:N-acetyltransferase domain-containing protein n=1 Tax=Scleroderma citrinum Foug A TaxID=1036808 RepID=A0A0C3E069_9AGAM|nr:hypothetical protein SCLCIDRAFT_111153 [Scleroderma citrinum Foug A]
MSVPNAQIRPYRPDDDKVVKFALGMAHTEGLAVANRRAALHPLTLSIWVALSCIMIEYFNWWPNPEHGFLGWLSPVPAFACWAVPILSLIDWVNRPYFEDVASDILRRPDVADIQEYYARSPSSGFFVLEYDNRVIGLIAVDASEDSQSDKNSVKTGEIQEKNRVSSKGTSSTAKICHIFVENPFRNADVQDDLVAFATNHAFTASSDVKEIKVTTSSLLGYVQNSLRHCKFTTDEVVERVGIYRWKTQAMRLKRRQWEKSRGKGAST